MGDLSANFNKSEFACPCCGVEKMQPEFIDLLQRARDYSPHPMKIISGYRCAKHNAELKDSKSDSAHLGGWAVDIACTSGAMMYDLFDLCRRVGFTRFGLENRVVDGVKRFLFHVDSDPAKPKNVIWTY